METMSELTGGQVRMARAFLRWSIGELAETAGVGLTTVQAIEKADGAPNVGLGMAQTKARREAVRADSVEAIRKTLVAAGIAFLSDDGKQGAGIRGKIKRRA
jgi:DNA-binding XRE family transcriptional regulator